MSTSTVRHPEHHRVVRTGWLCAAVLGANDGIVSTASLVLGVAAAGSERRLIDGTGRTCGPCTRRARPLGDDRGSSSTGCAGLGGQFLHRRGDAHGRGADGFPAHLIPWVSVASLGFLASLGALSARVGGAQIWRAMWRVAFWGAAAMAVTAAAGALFGAVARPADGLSHSDPAGRNLLPAELVRGCAEQRLLRRASHHESGASVRCRTDFGKARA